MPYRIRWEGHGVYRHFLGVITQAEFREANKEMRSDVRNEGTRYIISDFLEAQPAPDINERDLKAYAARERVYFYSSPDIVHASNPRLGWRRLALNTPPAATVSHR